MSSSRVCRIVRYDNAAGSHLHKHPWVSAVVSTPEQPGFFDHNAAGGDHQKHGCHARMWPQVLELSSGSAVLTSELSVLSCTAGIVGVREFGQDRKVGAVRIRYKDRTLVVKLIFSKVRCAPTRRHRQPRHQ